MDQVSKRKCSGDNLSGFTHIDDLPVTNPTASEHWRGLRQHWLLSQENHPLVSSLMVPSVLWCCWLSSRKGIRPVKNWVVECGVVICLERGADLHMAQLMPLPLNVSCFSKIQIGFTFLVLAYPGSPGRGPLKGCVCVCARVCGLIALDQSTDSWQKKFFTLYSGFLTPVLTTQSLFREKITICWNM